MPFAHRIVDKYYGSFKDLLILHYQALRIDKLNDFKQLLLSNVSKSFLKFF